MTFAKKYGQFFSTLNMYGKVGRIVKAIPEFQLETNPELSKLKWALNIAKKSDISVISRKNKESNYVVGIDDNIFNTFLNSEYAAIINGEYLMEVFCIGSRSYSESESLDLLSIVADSNKNYEQENENFKEIVKKALKFQLITKDINGFKVEYKTFNITSTIEKLETLSYFAMFTKSGNLIEFIVKGNRIISSDIEIPLIYQKDYKISMPIFSYESIPSISEEIIKESSMGSDEVLRRFFYRCATVCDDYKIITNREGIYSNESLYIYSLSFLDIILTTKYFAVNKGNRLLEYKKIGYRLIGDKPNVNTLLYELGFDNDYESFLKSYKCTIKNKSNIIIGNRKGKFTSEYYNYGSKNSAILFSDYFGIIDVNNGFITEFIKIDERKIMPDMNLPKI